MVDEQVLRAMLLPDWPAPPTVRAVATTRHGGVSTGPYSSLNLGDHVGDAPAQVAANRARLRQGLGLSLEPAWLKQVHGTTVVAAETVVTPLAADATYARTPGRACVVMTADCLPVLFCDRAGRWVAAAHAGWRGLVGGVLTATLAYLDCPVGEVLAWLGPAIGPQAFEVGSEVRQAFLARDPAAGHCFQPSSAGRWLADLYELARRQLRAAGITAIYGGGWCTFTETDQFFSYRRDGGCTGRMATLIWLN
jgi:YfiH family protein